MIDAADDTAPCSFTVRQVEPVTGHGRLIGLACIEADLNGVEVLLQGIQLVRRACGTVEARGPLWRHPVTGKWIPCMVLPDELRDAMGAEALASWAGT